MRGFIAILLLSMIVVTAVLVSDWNSAPTDTSVLTEGPLLNLDAITYAPEDCYLSGEEGSEGDLHKHVLTGEERTAVLHAHASGICAPSCYELQ